MFVVLSNTAPLMVCDSFIFMRSLEFLKFFVGIQAVQVKLWRGEARGGRSAGGKCQTVFWAETLQSREQAGPSVSTPRIQGCT